jgi:putative addiction module component (TIGR02574 family)
MEQLKPVADQALKLGPVERAELIEVLLASFDTAGRAEIDARWAEEAESRIDALEAGELSSSPAEDVFRRIDG